MNLTTKNKIFSRLGLKFSHIFEMNITFLACLLNVTYEHYLNLHMPMIDRVPKNIYIKILDLEKILIPRL